MTPAQGSPFPGQCRLLEMPSESYRSSIFPNSLPSVLVLLTEAESHRSSIHMTPSSMCLQLSIPLVTGILVRSRKQKQIYATDFKHWIKKKSCTHHRIWLLFPQPLSPQNSYEHHDIDTTKVHVWFSVYCLIRRSNCIICWHCSS